MACMPIMTLMSLAAAVVTRTGKIIKTSVFSKEEKICYKMVYLILCLR